MRHLLIAMLLGAAIAPTYAEVVADMPPPMPTEDTPTAVESGAPEVRIIEKADATIAEYRLHGKLYQVKVTPKVGQPYYLIDPTGKGEFMRREIGDNIAVPTWVLLEF